LSFSFLLIYPAFQEMLYKQEKLLDNGSMEIKKCTLERRKRLLFKKIKAPFLPLKIQESQ